MHTKTMNKLAIMSNILRNVFFVAAILNFKMADIGTIEKNGTKANFVPWTIMIKKNLGSKNVAEFLAKYITAYTMNLALSLARATKVDHYDVTLSNWHGRLKSPK